MAATLTQERFSGRRWLFSERKFDGIRLLAYNAALMWIVLAQSTCSQNLPPLEWQLRLPACPSMKSILDGE